MARVNPPQYLELQSPPESHWLEIIKKAANWELSVNVGLSAVKIKVFDLNFENKRKIMLIQMLPKKTDYVNGHLGFFEVFVVLCYYFSDKIFCVT